MKRPRCFEAGRIPGTVLLIISERFVVERNAR